MHSFWNYRIFFTSVDYQTLKQQILLTRKLKVINKYISFIAKQQSMLFLNKTTIQTFLNQEKLFLQYQKQYFSSKKKGRSQILRLLSNP
ncbi:hypothetical protein FGO68_gene7754 [Halteria grandinella]|uniref:Uncharacterized protein n=1 Tax=Halteria grandinella TaxID=5974 RepID=A0A8J8NHH0_HALGN|nr:hypothetical protein FGO68_gene7754 [Halteria grandinella]